MKKLYQEKRFQKKTLWIIQNAEQIIEEYMAQGFDLTIRQLYYQFVSRDLIPNKQKEYQKLVNIMKDARMAGMIDWNSIVDRTRNLKQISMWDDPGQILRSVGYQYKENPWRNQDYHIEVWIEKDALIGVIGQICNKWRVPYFACRGYNSVSEMWQSGNRMNNAIKAGKECIIIHLGDHDPSGIDMTRDIDDRMQIFCEHIHTEVLVKRIALNMNQVNEYHPPPNPTKLTDSRSDDYISKFGQSCWELDALDPTVIRDLIGKTILGWVDIDQWEKDIKQENERREGLQYISNNWEYILDGRDGE